MLLQVFVSFGPNLLIKKSFNRKRPPLVNYSNRGPKLKHNRYLTQTQLILIMKFQLYFLLVQIYLSFINSVMFIHKKINI